ncbi:lmo0937 family membrane protein [Peribacillus saganii]|uniref:Lmo0937 family membrane protein n=1 Tax=Peribacillus saganii TaxID=2303992 RepID=A0A372LK11_9BACI|nr:lmo0937 family membrane protein [Peribacillus saganii]RFU66354.1 lmo0937 family membrane protein [Peribacillus saganii]
MLWTIIGVLLLLWIVGLVFDLAGGMIHLLLIVAAVVFVFNFIKGRARR